MDPETARELLTREITPDLYRQIRDEWKRHSLAEDRRDIPGLLSTLTPDCEYHLPQVGRVWRGHEGAAEFYRHLLGAFPDVRFDLAHIVIGPQGVWESARLRGTHQGRWLDFAPTGTTVELTVSIYFPWDLERAKFKGEIVYFFVPGAQVRGSMLSGLSG
ncbi:MAG TPA: nuclear transport factor 2 family protein [Vicinamibacterales bacterium]|nr:nuclear transport factor 2 family protein [Vicinamibacterales bacterium]